MSPGAHIVVFGEALVDHFEDRQALGGAPFNVARNLAALGAPALLVSRVGLDPAGDRIAAQMARLGMGVAGLQRDPDHATGRVLVGLHEGQPEFRIEPDAAWDWLEPDAATRATHEARPAIMYFGTLAQRSAHARGAIRRALATGTATTFLDLNLRSMPDQRGIAEASLALADILKVNEGELQALFDWLAPGEDPTSRDAVFTLMDRVSLVRLIVTRGALGWACYEATSKRVLEGAAPTVVVRDTVGAGDAFAAVVLLGQLRDWPLDTTLERAATFSAAVCTLHGAFDEGASIYRKTLATWRGQG